MSTDLTFKTVNIVIVKGQKGRNNLSMSTCLVRGITRTENRNIQPKVHLKMGPDGLSCWIQQKQYLGRHFWARESTTELLKVHLTWPRTEIRTRPGTIHIRPLCLRFLAYFNSLAAGAEVPGARDLAYATTSDLQRTPRGLDLSSCTKTSLGTSHFFLLPVYSRSLFFSLVVI